MPETKVVETVKYLSTKQVAKKYAMSINNVLKAQADGLLKSAFTLCARGPGQFVFHPDEAERWHKKARKNQKDIGTKNGNQFGTQALRDHRTERRFTKMSADMVGLNQRLSIIEEKMGINREPGLPTDQK